MSPELKQALENLDEAIDRLEGRIDARKESHASLLRRLEAASRAEPDAETRARQETIAGRLDLAIERIETVLEEE